MNKKLLVTVVILLLVAAGCAYYFSDYKGSSLSGTAYNPQPTTNRKQVQSCDMSFSYPSSITKTEIRKSIAGEKAVNTYRWEVSEPKNKVFITWEAKDGFDPSSGESPLAQLEIRCLDNRFASLDEFKDYIVKESQNLDFEFIKSRRWDGDTYEVKYGPKVQNNREAHFLDDYFATSGSAFILVRNSKPYVIMKRDFKGYWSGWGEVVIEGSVDVNKDLNLILDSLRFQ